MSSIKWIILKKEMKENPELKMSDIRILKEWSVKQSHLPKIQDVQFAVFLHSNYYQIESTKRTIEKYYTFRTQMPEFFSNRDIFKDERLRKVFDVFVNINLEMKTKEGYHISIGKLIDFNPSHFDLNDTLKLNLMILDEYFWTRGLKSGFVFVLDGIGFSLGHVGRFSPMSLQKLVYYVQEAFPVRIKGIHVINTSPIIEMIFNICKPFMKDELVQLIHFHSSLDSASKYYPIDALPDEYGGKAGSTRDLISELIKRVENFHEWYLEDEKSNRVNESLRIDKSNLFDELFGTEGNFRKIEID